MLISSYTQTTAAEIVLWCTAGYQTSPAFQVTGTVCPSGTYPTSPPPGQSSSVTNPSALGPNPSGKYLGTSGGAPTAVNSLVYKPLEPLPGISNVENGSPANFSVLIGGLFKLLLGLGAMLAVVTIVFYGISYMTSAVVSVKSEARNRMAAALTGLLILLGAYLILYTINPNLLSFNLNLNYFSSPQTTSSSGNTNSLISVSGVGGVPNTTACTNGGGRTAPACQSGDKCSTITNDNSVVCDYSIHSTP